jgi:23S rRNA pseudouridine1911/1915/1917 synthase
MMISTEALHTFLATTDDAGKRLDHFLVANLPEISRSRVQHLIGSGKISVNGANEKASFKLRGHETVEVLGVVELPPLRAIPEDIPLDIVYEDDDFAVVNKSAGMMVHAGAGAIDGAHNMGTLVNALLHHFSSLSSVGGEMRPGIVHRLDKGTSGLLVVAKNDSAHRKLGEQFSNREIKKTYIALVHGWLKEPKGTIKNIIGRDAVRRTRMTTRRAEGREAITDYRVTKKLDTPWGKFSQVELRIHTGRTHQIRVHMSSLGHPVVGDTLYGAPRLIRIQSVVPTKKRSEIAAAAALSLSLDRNFLHAAALELTHPRSGEALKFSRPIPEELAAFLAQLESAPSPKL